VESCAQGKINALTDIAGEVNKGEKHPYWVLREKKGTGRKGTLEGGEMVPLTGSKIKKKKMREMKRNHVKV